MTTIPQDLLDLLDEAEKQLEEANAASVFHQVKVAEFDDAVEAEAEAQQMAFDQLSESNAAAGIALDALRKHFGV